MKKEKLDILYEDKFLIIVNKKSGILTIANDKEKEKTLYHEVHEYLWRKNKNNKVFIIHRLDKDTSGIVIFAKNDKIKKIMQDNWENVQNFTNGKEIVKVIAIPNKIVNIVVKG